MKRTVILAAGEFPKRGGEAWRRLETASRVVACDSAAVDYWRRFGRWPEVVVGDLDSIGKRKMVAAEVVQIADQDTNDIEKAIKLCAERGWKSPVIVGATGKREDHMLGNIFRVFEYGLEIITDYGRFIPVCGRVKLRTRKGAAVSIFATDPKTRMASRGLEWPLDKVRFRNLYCATLNRATTALITLTSSKLVYVFIEL